MYIYNTCTNNYMNLSNIIVFAFAPSLMLPLFFGTIYLIPIVPSPSCI